MLFFLAVLLTWGTTAVIARQAEWVLPDLLVWSWWTICLYGCGVASLRDKFQTLQSRVMGALGFSLFVVYYTTMSAVYLTFLPSNPDIPNFWPTVYMTVNLLGPLLMVSAGCMRAAIQENGG